MTRYVSLAEYFWLAEQVTEIEATVLIKAARVDLADSALHAPRAGFGQEDFYSRPLRQGRRTDVPTRVEPSVARRHKRAAWAALVMFVDLNGSLWVPDPPDVDDAEAATFAVAAGKVDEEWLAEWLRNHVQFR